ncbi:MAG: hypothetical protein KIT56_10135, partial [Gammaproteobacteria bacterium]|nr:hypothetical protein [Gammaproteobacteria bacterium]
MQPRLDVNELKAVSVELTKLRNKFKESNSKQEMSSINDELYKLEFRILMEMDKVINDKQVVNLKLVSKLMSVKENMDNAGSFLKDFFGQDMAPPSLGEDGEYLELSELIELRSLLDLSLQKLQEVVNELKGLAGEKLTLDGAQIDHYPEIEDGEDLESLLKRLETGDEKTGDEKSKKQAMDDMRQKLQGGDNDLYEGIDKYQQFYGDAVEKYEINHQSFIQKIKESLSTESLPDPKKNHTYFRHLFVAYLQNVINSPEGLIDDDKKASRESDPEKATIKAKDLLGKEGLELYKLALEEEMNSKAYMNAVLDKSTTVHEGWKGDKRPVIIIGGPSASGKTTAKKEVIEKLVEEKKRNNKEAENLLVIAVDGGDAREVSQMR